MKNIKNYRKYNASTENFVRLLFLVRKNHYSRCPLLLFQKMFRELKLMYRTWNFFLCFLFKKIWKVWIFTRVWDITFWDFGIPLEKKSQSQKSLKITGILIWDFFGKIIPKIPGFGIWDLESPRPGLWKIFSRKSLENYSQDKNFSWD